jgi:hypothetical protein
MMFRIVLGAVLVLGAGVGWFVAAAPSIMLGSIKDDYVKAVEEGGIDMSKCKARQKTLLDPSGGMQQCVQDVFVEVQKQITEIEDADREARSWNSEPRAEEPSYDWSHEAPPAEEPSSDE